MGRLAHTVERFYLAQDSRGNWNVQWQCPKENKVKRRGCGTKDKDQARARMPAIVASITNPPPPASYTVGELIDAYATVRTAPGKKYSPTFHHNLTHVKLFFGSYRPSQLNEAAYDAYRANRTAQTHKNASSQFAQAAKPVSDSTAIRELNALAGTIIWGSKNGWAGLTDVSVSRKGHVRNTRVRWLTRNEATRLLAVLEGTPHLALFVRLALATGARMGALLELTWDRISWPLGEPYNYEVVAEDDAAGTLTANGINYNFEAMRHRLVAPLQIDLGQGRGNKRRGTGVVGLTNLRLYAALQRSFRARYSFRPNDDGSYSRDECPFVVHFRNKGISSVDLSDAYKRAGIEGANVHTLKHTCCTWLVQAGVSYEKVAKMIGTTARVIEQHYGHWSPEHLATAGDVLNV